MPPDPVEMQQSFPFTVNPPGGAELTYAVTNDNGATTLPGEMLANGPTLLAGDFQT